VTIIPEMPMSSGRSGAREEFEAFYADQFHRLILFCCRLGVSRHTAQDIAQEAFVQVFKRWAVINRGAALAYLRKTAYHLVIKRPAEQPSADISDKVCSLPGVLAFEDRHVIIQAGRRLPSQQQAVFALHYDGYSTEEIAEILDIGAATVRSHLRHARDHLREWLAHEKGPADGKERR
jgi:RNA polymerase sigma factor (sigma-70 family)